ncbi:Armadillo-like helical [Neofusicoccum parvum]|nr:Armadillo-like helical [Neofusicoccum parvum]
MGSSEERELALIGKVELRIALADSDAKLQSILHTYLGPLLLKLASEHVGVISICQHINTRVRPQEIQLPVAALLKQFKEHADTPLIRHFDLLYVQQGISRLPLSERLGLLPVLINGIAADTEKSVPHGSQLFNLLLREKLTVSKEDAKFLSLWFGKLILFSPLRASPDGSNVACPGLSPDEYQFLTLQGKPGVWDPSAEGGMNLAEAKVVVSKFLASGMFTDDERFFPAVYASADSNSRISEIGDDILKRTLPNTDLEDQCIISSLYDIYFGTSRGQLPARPALKIKILSYFTKSVAATTFTSKATRLVEEGLTYGAVDEGSNAVANGSSARGREATKLRAAIFSFVNFMARRGSAADLHAVGPTLVQRLRAFIEDQGWPKPNPDEDVALRGYVYEVIGLLAKAAPEEVLLEPSLNLLRWLFRSLSDDTSGRDTAVSIDEALSSVLGALATSSNADVQRSLRELLLEQMTADEDANPNDSTSTFRRSTRYAAVRFANRCLPYKDIVARWIDLLAVSGPASESQEVREEGSRGLDPHWSRLLHSSQSGVGADGAAEPHLFFPDFAELSIYVLSLPEVSAATRNAWRPNDQVRHFKRYFPHAFAPTVKFCYQILMDEALRTHDATNLAISELSLFFVVKAERMTDIAKINFTLFTDKLVENAKTGNEKAILALGHLAMIVDDESDPNLDFVGTKIFELHEIRQTETQFAVGEAIAFKSCLSDRDEVVQEAASRGLGLVYEKGDRQLKDDLVRDLVGSFSDNKPNLSGNVSDDTQLFEPGALPTGDGSVTTYKDILNLASEGRSIEKYEQYLGQIWTACFKVLDDIKESVRVAAAGLARVLTAILTRSLEAGDTSVKNADTMLKNVLPFLLSTSGLESSAKEVQGFALHTLLEIIKKSSAKILRPYIPELIERLIGLLSSIEHEAVNYIHLNAAKYNLTEQKIDDMRLASVRGSPLMEAIERCLDLLDDDSMKALEPRLENAMKTAIGLPSKILDLIGFCKRMYFESDDDRHRTESGDVVAAISKHASDKFNALSTELLPFVYVAKHDSSEAVRELFSRAWDDNVGGSLAVQLYVKDIVAIAQERLDSPRWTLKHTAAKAIAEATNALASTVEDISLPNAETIWPALDKALGGKSWDGKEVVLQAFARFVERGGALWKTKQEVADQIKKVIVREAKRQNKTYRQHALKPLGRVAAARTDIDWSETVFDVVSPVVDELTEGDEDAMDVDAGEGMRKDEKLRDNTATGAIFALQASINPRLLQDTALSGAALRGLTLALKLNSLHSNAVHVAVFEGLQSLFDRVFTQEPTGSFSTGNESQLKEVLEKLLFDARYDGLKRGFARGLLVGKLGTEVENERSPLVRAELEKAKTAKTMEEEV